MKTNKKEETTSTQTEVENAAKQVSTHSASAEKPNVGLAFVAALMLSEQRYNQLFRKLRAAVKGENLIPFKEVNEIGYEGFKVLSPVRAEPSDLDKCQSIGHEIRIPAYESNQWIRKLLEMSTGRKVLKIKLLLDLTEEEKKICGDGPVCDGLVHYFSYAPCDLPTWGLKYREADGQMNDVMDCVPGYYLKSKKGGKKGKARFERFKQINGPRIDKQLMGSFSQAWDRIEKEHPEIAKLIPGKRPRKTANKRGQSNARPQPSGA